MARGLFDELSTAASVVPADPAQLVPLRARTILLSMLSLAAAMGILAVIVAATPPAREPELARLLHMIIGIKALIFMIAAALVFRRLGRPVQLPLLLKYGAGLGLSASALVWLWSLTDLLLVSILFYAGLLVTYLTASRDPWLLQGLLGERFAQQAAGIAAAGTGRHRDA